MLRRLFSAALAVLLTAGCLTSCNYVASEPRDLLLAPTATGVMGEIQKALYDYAGRGITLRFPRSGDNRTAFFLCDLDRDGSDEAVAFYANASSDENGVDTVHNNLIDRVDGVWRSVYDAATTGNAIDKVEVADISGGGPMTLMVGVELFTSMGNQLNLYTYENGALTQHAQENYTQFLVYDLMGTGNNQLILLSLDAAERMSTVTVYTFNGDAIERRGVVATDGNISGYAQVTAGQLEGGRPALFLDANKSAVSMVTDVIYYAENGLVSPFYDVNLGESQMTLRNSTDVCRDINGDGVIEIPFTEMLPGYASRSEADRLYLTVWKSFDGQRFRDQLRADYFRAAGYRLAFPAAWVGSVTVVSDSSTRMRSYRVWDPEQQTTGAEILRIRAYEIEAFDRIQPEGVLELARNETTVWAARLVMTEGEYALTEETLRALFALE